VHARIATARRPEINALAGAASGLQGHQLPSSFERQSLTQRANKPVESLIRIRGCHVLLRLQQRSDRSSHAKPIWPAERVAQLH
jgi:hypothetical protein